MSAIIDDIIRDVSELPDRTSPDNQPDMMLVSADELHTIIDHRLRRLYPVDLTPDLTDVLGWPNFRCGPLAHAMRAAGADIPHASEVEQAHVIHWLIGLVLEHGSDWRGAASAGIEDILARARANDAPPMSGREKRPIG